MPGQFRFVHIGIAAALAAAAVTAVGVVREVGAAGTGTVSSFVPIVPCRLADTRVGTDHVGPQASAIGAGASVTFAVWGTNGNCTIPTTATGIATNVTAVNPTAASFLTIYPSDANRPTASNLNWTPTSPPTPNQVTVGLSADGSINAYNLAGTIDVIIDIVGYYQAAITGPQGPVGATIVYTGQSSVTNSATSLLDIRYGCRTMAPNTVAYINLALPVGAMISTIKVTYKDAGAGTLIFDLYEVTVPGVSELNPTPASFLSVDGGTSGDLVMLAHPPAAANAAYYIQAFAVGTGTAFCGAAVTYTF